MMSFSGGCDRRDSARRFASARSRARGPMNSACSTSPSRSTASTVHAPGASLRFVT